MTEIKTFEPRVLVVDDDPSIRQLVGTIVRREKLPFDEAADGAEAIRLLEQNHYAVVVLDLMMPRVDGFGVIQHLVENPPPHKPVVLVATAYADQNFKKVDPNIVAGVIRKPFEVSELGDIVKRCVTGFMEAIQTTSPPNPHDETVRINAPHSFGH